MWDLGLFAEVRIRWTYPLGPRARCAGLGCAKILDAERERDMVFYFLKLLLVGISP